VRDHHATREQARQSASDLLERGRLAYVGGADAVDADRAELAVELDIFLPSISEHTHAAALVRKAHQICPYSRATRGNTETALRVNGVAAPVTA